MSTRSKSGLQTTTEAKSRTVSRGGRDGAQIWIIGALSAIARDGAETIRIEKLAKQIKVSKGSFYWFFDGLDDLLLRVLDYWKTHLNDVVFDQVKTSEGSLEDKLHLLIDSVFQRKLGKYDAAIRAWALRAPHVQSFVANVDRERLEFLEQLFIENAPEAADNRHRAHLFYRAFIAESYLHHYPHDNRDADYLKDLVRLLACSRLTHVATAADRDKPPGLHS